MLVSALSSSIRHSFERLLVIGALVFLAVLFRPNNAKSQTTSLVEDLTDDIRVPVADDPNDQISEAVAFGSMAQSRVGTGTIDVPADVDLWSFNVVAGQRISFDVDLASGSTLDSYIRLFDT